MTSIVLEKGKRDLMFIRKNVFKYCLNIRKWKMTLIFQIEDDTHYRLLAHNKKMEAYLEEEEEIIFPKRN